jgi:very-short-patch-repair endonuclease
MDAVELVRQTGGVARSADLVRRGVRKRAIADAVAGGRLLRLRRVWIAVPDADPMLVAAAREGVLLTCVTQARRLGLWVLGSHRAHVAAPPHAGGITLAGATVHWDAPLIPRPPDALVDPVENVLAVVARCQAREAALAIWESALRMGLVDQQILKRLPLAGRARELLEEASPWSDSGLETFVIPRLRWLRVRLTRQAWIAGHRVDLLIGERLVLQIDGATHVGPQREADITHDAQLALLGYTVIRVGYRQIVEDWPAVQARIMTAVAQGLHSAR